MKKEILDLKKIIITTSFRAQEGHIPSAFSILDLLYILYTKVKQKDDFFILSKGQASLALYAVLTLSKPREQKKLINSFCKFNSRYGGHPDRNKLKEAIASTGSLGHGFPFALGIALGLKIKNKKARVFTLVGDGECNEGSVWETALLGAQYNLNNLCCIVDNNHSSDRALNLGNLKIKFKAFGWKTIEINGHNCQEIYQALNSFSETKPLAIIANTVKGHGCRIIENNPAWHHKSPNKEELTLLLENLS